VVSLQWIALRTEAQSSSMRTRRWKIFWLLLLLPGRLLSGQTGSPRANSEKGQTRDALELHLGNGYESLKLEKYEEAEREFRVALTMAPELVMRARFPLGVALFEQHKIAEARHEFETVRRAVGDQPSVMYYLGRIDLEEQNYQGAMGKLSKASSQPPFPDTAFYLGFAYLKLGSHPEAEKWLKKAIELNPGDSRAEYELARLYRQQGRQEEAKQAFQVSEEKKAQSDQRSQLKWECAQELDRDPSDKVPSCEQLYDPNDAETLTALGILYGQHARLEMALKPLQRAAELVPQSPQMQYNLAFTYFQLKRFEEARVPLKSALLRWPDLFSLNALYGAVLWNLGDLLPAYQALHHAYHLNTQDSSTNALLYQVTMELSKQCEKMSADSNALGYLQEAASLSPADPEPHRRMAVIYKRTGRSQQAIREEQKAEAIIKSSKN